MTAGRVCGDHHVDAHDHRVRGVAAGGGAQPDGVHARLPHHPGVAWRGVPGDDADRQLPRPAPRRRGRAAARPALVEGRGGDLRRRRGHRDRAVVRVRPAVAGVHGPLRQGLRRPVRDRGDLLLPRGDLRRHLHLRLEAPGAVDALLGGRADRDHRPRRRVLGRGGQLVDEPAAGVLAHDRRRDQGRAAEGDLQPGGALRGPAHDPRGLPASPGSSSPRSTPSGMLRGRRDRYHRLGLLIPLTVACIATPIQFAVGDTAARAIAKDQPVKFAGMECVQQTSTDVTEYIYGRCTANGVKGGIGIPGLRLVPRRLEHRHEGHRPGHACRRTTARPPTRCCTGRSTRWSGSAPR